MGKGGETGWGNGKHSRKLRGQGRAWAGGGSRRIYCALRMHGSTYYGGIPSREAARASPLLADLVLLRTAPPYLKPPSILSLLSTRHWPGVPLAPSGSFFFSYPCICEPVLPFLHIAPVELGKGSPVPVSASAPVAIHRKRDSQRNPGQAPASVTNPVLASNLGMAWPVLPSVGQPSRYMHALPPSLLQSGDSCDQPHDVGGYHGVPRTRCGDGLCRRKAGRAHRVLRGRLTHAEPRAMGSGVTSLAFLRTHVLEK